jgi:DNA polymerase phi
MHIHFWTLDDMSACQLQALLLALRLWPLMPQQLRDSCALLPVADISDLPASGGSSHTTVYAASGQGAAAFFASSHLSKLLPVFRATSGAHPRLHTLWPTVLALLLPGFAPKRVSIG